MNWDWDKLQEKRQRQNWGNNTDNNGNNGNNRDQEPSYDGGGKGPDYDKLSDAFKRLPHLSTPSGGKVKWILLALVGVWLLSGIYIVNPDEEGVVLRFGKYVRTVGAGPHYALPFPIETVYKPKVTQVQRVDCCPCGDGGMPPAGRGCWAGSMPTGASMMRRSRKTVWRPSGRRWSMATAWSWTCICWPTGIWALCTTRTCPGPPAGRAAWRT